MKNALYKSVTSQLAQKRKKIENHYKTTLEPQTEVVQLVQKIHQEDVF